MRRPTSLAYAGNVHTPAWSAWLGMPMPGPFGNIDQQVLAGAIAKELALRSRETGEVELENAAMKKLAAHGAAETNQGF